MARIKNHKPGLNPGSGITYTPSNDATYTESFNDYLKKRNINRNQAIGELLTVALQQLQESYDLPDPTKVSVDGSTRQPVYPSPTLQTTYSNVQNESNRETNKEQKEIVEKPNASLVNESPKIIEEKREKILSFIQTTKSNEEKPKSPEKAEESTSKQSSSKTDLSSLASMLKGME